MREVHRVQHWQHVRSTGGFGKVHKQAVTGLNIHHATIKKKAMLWMIDPVQEAGGQQAGLVDMPEITVSYVMHFAQWRATFVEVNSSQPHRPELTQRQET